MALLRHGLTANYFMGGVLREIGYNISHSLQLSKQIKKTDPKGFQLQTDTRLLFIGFGIGMGISLIGGAIDYLINKRRRNPQQSNHLPGCIMYVAGALGLASLLVIFISIILIGSVIPAIVLGAGVLSGFYTGFALLMLLYLVARRIWSRLDL